MSLSVARSSVATFTFLIFFTREKKNLGPDNSKRLHSFIAPSWVLAETGYYMRALDHHPDMKKKKKDFQVRGMPIIKEPWLGTKTWALRVYFIFSSI